MKWNSPKAPSKMVDTEMTVLHKLKKINHRNSIKVISCSTQACVMEKCSNGELFDVLFNTPEGFSETTVRVILRHLLKSYNHIRSVG